jgi:catechol 2,3-dioxygenase-like lactoylglutathione lyase family enzyme
VNRSVPAAVTQLRLVVTVDDLDQALAFYRDTLGLPVELDIASEHGARVVILHAGRATLELSNRAQAELIDEVEVGRRVAPPLRVALQVADTAATTDRLVAAGAALIAAPTPTPWNSLNSRLEAPAGLQITLFEELPPDPAP